MTSIIIRGNTYLCAIQIQYIMSNDSEKCCKNNNSSHASGGAVYGLGFIGAAVYFISQAATFGAGLVGFLKAMVWPAFLVYEAFKALGA